MTKKLVVFGAGQIAEIAHYYFESDSDFEVVAFAVDREFSREPSFCNRPLLAFDELSERFPPDECKGFVAISYSGLNKVRAAKYAAMKQAGYDLITYISSKASVWPDICTGDNCFILEDNTVQPFARIGANVTLWSGNHIGHHSVIGDNVFVSSHVVISGNVVIGANSFVGVNSTIYDGVAVGANNMIGAGSLIDSDTGDEAVFKASATAKSRVPSSRLRHL